MTKNGEHGRGVWAGEQKTKYAISALQFKGVQKQDRKKKVLILSRRL